MNYTRAAVAGPFDIDKATLEGMITRVLAAPRPASPPHPRLFTDHGVRWAVRIEPAQAGRTAPFRVGTPLDCQSLMKPFLLTLTLVSERSTPRPESPDFSAHGRWTLSVARRRRNRHDSLDDATIRQSPDELRIETTTNGVTEAQTYRTWQLDRPMSAQIVRRFAGRAPHSSRPSTKRSTGRRSRSPKTDLSPQGEMLVETTLVVHHGYEVTSGTVEEQAKNYATAKNVFVRMR